LRILSLDGGGIRGLSSLFVLQDIMERITVQEGLETTPLPCEWFDLIVGTSTGGLIALMLGRLKMTVSDAIDAYNQLSGKVFGMETSSWLGTATPRSQTSWGSPREILTAIWMTVKRVFSSWYHKANPISSAPVYSAEQLEAAIPKFAKEEPLKDPKDPKPDLCC
jgi:hypothetical protein